jgi:hypothetical protein
MMLRMEHLFDEVETRCLGMTRPDSEVLQLLSAPKVGPGGLCIRGYYSMCVLLVSVLLLRKMLLCNVF